MNSDLCMALCVDSLKKKKRREFDSHLSDGYFYGLDALYVELPEKPAGRIKDSPSRTVFLP
jgi:hypothetical protein